MNLTDLDTFLRVANAGSFTKAAQQLGVPKSTVSRRVARLEDVLGVTLLTRKARSFMLSEQGRFLQERCSSALEQIDSVQQALAEASGEPAGLLRVTTNSDMGKAVRLHRFIAEFRRTWPRIELEFELTSRRVDIIEEGFDVAFRAHSRPLPDSSTLMTRRLQAGSAALFASRDYLDHHGSPRSPAALVKHDCLTLRAPEVFDAWTLRRRGSDETVAFPIRRVLSSNDFTLLLGAALEGVGIALLPSFLFEPCTEDAALVSVLPRWELTNVGFLSLVWPRSRYPSPRLRVFIDAAAKAFG